MEDAKVHLGYASALRMSVVTGFVAVSLLTFYLSESVTGAPIVQLDILLSFVFLGTGILASRPDFEVLAWVLLGTGLLLVVSSQGAEPLWTLVAALGVVCMADFTHSVAIMYPRGGVVDVAHEIVRRRLLVRRAVTVGSTALASLTISVLGASLAPPLLLSGNPAAAVGVFAVAVLLLIATITSIENRTRSAEPA